MTLRVRILLFYVGTLGLALAMVAYWTHFEFAEQRDLMIRAGSQAASVESPTWETLEVFLYGGLPAVLLSLLFGTLLVKYTLRPIESLTSVLEKTEIGNLAQPVSRSGNGDELDRMAAVFNDMRRRLSAAFRQTREFTLHASHELKTPLTIMHSTLEQMLDDPAASQASRDRIASLLEEVQRLSAVVGQLAFLAKADAGLLAGNQDLLSFDELVREVTEDAAILAAGAAVTVTLSVCAPVRLCGDRMRLRQLLLNLADNAVKYNCPGGHVELALEKHKDSAVFSITNTGPALPLEKRTRVFERFFRGDAAHNTAIEGSGLGLSIAQSIVEMHQGGISYEVLSDGRTQVTVILPA